METLHEDYGAGSVSGCKPLNLPVIALGSVSALPARPVGSAIQP
jgi:hypothetical protein